MYFPTNEANGNIIVTNPPILASQAEQAQTSAYQQTFLKGQPKALGAIQISLGFVQFAVGSILLFTLNAYTSVTVYSWITYWGGLLYIISGSLAVAAVNKPSRGLVKWTLSTNLISFLASFSEVALVIIDLAHTYYYNYGPCYHNPCSLFQDTILVIRLIVLIFLVFSSVLQFSMSVSVFAFSIRSLKEKSAQFPQQVIMVQNGYQNPSAFPHVSVVPENLKDISSQPDHPPPYNPQQPQ